MTFSRKLIYEPPSLVLDYTVPFKMGQAFLIPEQPAVYFIHDLRGIIYVGRTENLKRRFTQHYWKQSNEILVEAISRPLGKLLFSWNLSGFPEQILLERKLIRDLQPPCNRTSLK